MKVFADRAEAGRLLAKRLESHVGQLSTVVLGIPRGGVVVAYEVADALHLPLDIFVVRKLGVPGQSELAMGAVAGGGHYLLNQDVVRAAGVSESDIQEVLEQEQKELKRRERVYRQGRKALPLSGRTVILVDDGLATGASVRVAIRMLHKQNLKRLILAVPVAPRDTCEALRAEVDELVCLETPEFFHAIGNWYKDFSPTADEEVCRLLYEANARPLSSAA